MQIPRDHPAHFAAAVEHHAVIKELFGINGKVQQYALKYGAYGREDEIPHTHYDKGC